MAITLSNNVPSQEVDEGTGNLSIAPAAGGALKLQDDTEATQLEVTQTGIAISNNLSVTGTAQVGGSAVLTSANTPILNANNTYTGTTNTFNNNVTVSGTLTAATSGLTNSTNKNLISDSDVTKLANVPANTTSSLNGKANLSGANFIGQITVDTNVFPQTKLANSLGNQKTGIGYQDETSNYKAGTFYSDATSRFYFTLGSNSNLDSLPEIFSFGASSIRFMQDINITDKKVNIITTDGSGYLRLERSTNPTNLKQWWMQVNSDGGLFIDSRLDSASLRKRFIFGHSTGSLTVPGQITQNNGATVIDSAKATSAWSNLQNALNSKASLTSPIFTGVVTAIGLDINGNADISGSLAVGGNTILPLVSVPGTGHTSTVVTFDTNSAPQVRTANNSNAQLSFIGHEDESGNLRSVSGFDDTVNEHQIRLGTSTSISSLITRLKINGANGLTTILGNLVVNGEVEGTSLDINGNANISGSLVLGSTTMLPLAAVSGTGHTSTVVTFDTNSAPQVRTANNSNGQLSFIGHEDESGNLRAVSGFNDGVNEYQVRLGTSTNINSLTTRFKISGVNGLTTISGNLVVIGEVEGSSLDINGNADISGVLTYQGTSLTTTLNNLTTSVNNKMDKVHGAINNSGNYNDFRTAGFYAFGNAEDITNVPPTWSSGADFALLHVMTYGANNGVQLLYTADRDSDRTFTGFYKRSWEASVFTDWKEFGGRPKDITYFGSFTVPTAEIIAYTWVGNSVIFSGINNTTITLPQIVASGPSATQIVVGDSFYIYNMDSNSTITLTPASGQNKWIRDDDADIVTGNITLGSNQVFKITVCDFTNFSPISNTFGFAVRRISSNTAS